MEANMFDTKKTLIVVYKDELLMNQLKKLVETKDDNEDGIVGTKDDSINIVAWDEKVWLANKKSGNIKGKILFLGDIKDIDKLIPVLDLQIDEYGVKFGWAGNQAVLYTDINALKARSDYDEFLNKLSSLPVPEFLKTEKNSIIATGIIPVAGIHNESENKNKFKLEIPDFLKPVENVLAAEADNISKVVDQLAERTEELFRNKELMKKQMLFYGVVRVYNEGLEEFMEQ